MSGAPTGLARRDEGAAALLTLGVSVAAVFVGLLMVTVTTQWVAAAARAQAAADAAALAAAGATPLGPAPAAPRQAAAEAARHFGATVVACCGDIGALPPRVHVRVAVRPAGLAGMGGRRVGASATASLRPRIRAPRREEPSGFGARMPISDGGGASDRSRR